MECILGFRFWYFSLNEKSNVDDLRKREELVYNPHIIYGLKIAQTDYRSNKLFLFWFAFYRLWNEKINKDISPRADCLSIIKSILSLRAVGDEVTSGDYNNLAFFFFSPHTPPCLQYGVKIVSKHMSLARQFPQVIVSSYCLWISPSYFWPCCFNSLHSLLYQQVCYLLRKVLYFMKGDCFNVDKETPLHRSLLS